MKYIYLLIIMSLSLNSYAGNVFSHIETFENVIIKNFYLIDKDKNNFISESELKNNNFIFNTLIDRYFSEVDGNKDGYLSKYELMTSSKNRYERNVRALNEMWDEYNVNRDNYLTKKELPWMVRWRFNFDEHDKNGDGKITKVELLNAANIEIVRIVLGGRYK